MSDDGARIVHAGVTPREWVPQFFEDVAAHCERYRSEILRLHSGMTGEFEVLIWSAKTLAALAKNGAAVSTMNGRVIGKPYVGGPNTRFVILRRRYVIEKE